MMQPVYVTAAAQRHPAAPIEGRDGRSDKPRSTLRAGFRPMLNGLSIEVPQDFPRKPKARNTVRAAA